MSGMRACGTDVQNDIQQKYAWYVHEYYVLQVFHLKNVT